MPALFPADPARRRAVLEAEEWGEREFQPVPPRLLRWGFRKVNELLRWEFVSELRRLGPRRIPVSRVLARATLPLAAYFARVSDATEAAVRGDLERLSALLENVERLVQAGTIGGAEPNAADFQVGTTARLLYAFEGSSVDARGNSGRGARNEGVAGLPPPRPAILAGALAAPRPAGISSWDQVSQPTLSLGALVSGECSRRKAIKSPRQPRALRLQGFRIAGGGIQKSRDLRVMSPRGSTGSQLVPIVRSLSKPLVFRRNSWKPIPV